VTDIYPAGMYRGDMVQAIAELEHMERLARRENGGCGVCIHSSKAWGTSVCERGFAPHKGGWCRSWQE
jgi:hypothetical protein